MRRTGAQSHIAPAHRWRRDGYAPKIEAYDQELILTIQRSYLEKIDDPRYSKPNRTKVGTAVSRAIINPIIHIPDLAKLIDAETRGAIECYYDSYFRVAAVQAWRNYSLPTELQQDIEAYSNWWHFDARPIDNIKIFVDLSDVDDDCGPFHFIPAKRSRQLVRMGFKRARNGLPLNEEGNKQYIVRATGPAGTAVYCNTELCLHRAGVPAKGKTRDIIQFRFLPSNVPLPPDWGSQPLQDQR